MSLEIFSYNIKQIRKRLRINQGEAAKLIGIKHGTLGAYEQGRAYPHIDTMVKLCEVYGKKDIVLLVTKKIEDWDNYCPENKIKSLYIVTPSLRVKLDKIKEIVDSV